MTAPGNLTAMRERLAAHTAQAIPAITAAIASGAIPAASATSVRELCDLLFDVTAGLSQLTIPLEILLGDDMHKLGAWLRTHCTGQQQAVLVAAILGHDI